MNAMQFLISTLFDLYLMVVLLRLWLQLARADFYNPLSQFVVKATHTIVGPLRRLLPSLGRIDTATLVLAFAIGCLKVVALSLLIGNINLDPIAVVITGGLIVLKEMFSLVFWILILRAILSWVSQGNNPIEGLMHQLTEPMLAPIRRILPAMGGLDLSILVAIVALQFIQILFRDLFGGVI